MNLETIRIGAIGTGGFGHFALQQFLQIPGTLLTAIAGTHREASIAMARRFGVIDVEDVDVLIARQDVDLVYIATPPFLHFQQAKAALSAGKHVICEKPLALAVEEAAELIALAKENNLLCVANLMQRYNPMYELVQWLVDSKVLGECLHGYFENYASDEGLSPEHWFWDREKSGGLFLEHGVHFFDMFEGWQGAGTVVSAQRVLRPGSGFEEQVQCTVKYPTGALVNFYHGFTQLARLDRQEFRLLFERGDITLQEWVPIRATIRAVVDEEQTRQLVERFKGARLDVLRTFGGRDREARGRHKDVDVYQQIELHHGFGDDKQRRYSELLRNFMGDQLAWIRDPSHQRKITEQNGYNSVVMAATATELANKTTG